MELYEKSGEYINVYELKVLRDKLFLYKKSIFDKIDKDKLVYRLYSNSSNDIVCFLNSDTYDVNKFIKKENRYFIHRNGLKLENCTYSWDNKIIIDGLVYQIINNVVFLVKPIILTGDREGKKLLPTTFDWKFSKSESWFDGGFYKYELPNLVSIPEKIIDLNNLLNKDLFEVFDKDIDEQLSLFEFSEKPIARLDIDTLNYFKKKSMDEYLFDDGLEVSEAILKKVRHIKR